MRTRRSRLALVLGIAALQAAACSDRPPAGELVALTADPGVPRDERFLAWGETHTIADEPRLALSSSKAIIPPAEVTTLESGFRRVGAQIPVELKALPWMVFESTATRAGATTMMRSWPVVGAVAGTTYAVGIVEDKLGADGTAGIRIWPIPDLAARDVETAAMTVQPGTELRAAVGVERSSWDSTIVPIDMRVTAIADGKEIPIGSTQVDVRKPEQRRWRDVTFPLDAVAGRTVRFRFAARPIVGPTTVATLPIWADAVLVPSGPAS